ncbi:S41 family peptidase [Microbulbifer epialgicus]|uniref:S41 family peptidase n=1 Tax=Microbulbifer epialgicus TaxID=393907 RepID=A0ABV4P027_9GAMM
MEEPTRNEGWTKDLNFLLSEIKRLHVDPYHKTSAKQLEEHTKLIETNISNLTDQEIVFEFMQLLASVGNGHNFIVPTQSLKGTFSQLPIYFYWFNDGIYIVSADQSHKHLVGRKVISVEGLPINFVMEKISSINARDNEMQRYWLAPFYLSLPEVLKGLGIAADTNNVSLTLADENGSTEKVVLHGNPFSSTGFPTLPKLESSENPLYLKRKKENYWQLNNKEDNYLYIQFNTVAQKKSQSLQQFSKEIRKTINQDKIENIILDLRHNSGGNGSILPALTRTLIYFSEKNTKNKLFVIVGRNTFSAAHLLLADLNRLTDAIIVGKPSGSRPNHLGEAGWFKLPHSGAKFYTQVFPVLL